MGLRSGILEGQYFFNFVLINTIQTFFIVNSLYKKVQYKTLLDLDHVPLFTAIKLTSLHTHTHTTQTNSQKYTFFLSLVVVSGACL